MKAKWDHALIVCMLGLRVWLLGSTHYWYDESFTALLARLPLGKMIYATSQDVHPPLYYLLIWVTQRLISGFATPEFTQRFYSLIFSAAALITFWFIMGRLQLSPRVKIAAAFLFALSPVQAYYGQEGRMYALLEFLVLLQVWGILARRWVIVGIATLTAVYTHNYGIIYSLVSFALALGFELTKTTQHPSTIQPFGDDPIKYPNIKSQFPQLLGSFAIPALLYVPWVFYGLIPQTQFAKSGEHWIQPITPGNILENQVRILIGNYYPRWAVMVLIMLCFAGLILLVRANWKTNKRLIWLGFGPLAVTVLVSYVLAPVLLYRGLLPATPFIFAAAAAAIEKARPLGKWLGLGILGIILALGLGNMVSKAAAGDLHNYYLDPDEPFPSGSLVVHLEDTTYITYASYNQTGAKQVLLSGCPDGLGALGDDLRGILGVKRVTLGELPQHYYLVAAVSIVSTQCHQQTLQTLKADMRTLAERETEFGIEGIYEK